MDRRARSAILIANIRIAVTACSTLAGVNLRSIRNTSIILALSSLLLAGAGLYLTRHRLFKGDESPRELVRAYFSAVYARDFKAAYPLLAAPDRKIRDEAHYVASQGQYDGFTLEVSRRLASFMKVWLIEQKASSGRLLIKVGYRVPAPAELNDLLMNWDQDRLNNLSMEKQKALLAELDARNNSGKLLNIEGQEEIELIEEDRRWKIFLDWAAGTRVLLASKISGDNKLEVRFATTEVLAKHDELFLVNVKIRNPSARAVTFTVSHLLEPPAAAEDLQLVECGLLVPITLEPQQEKEFAMAYLLNSTVGQTYREIKLTYGFKLK